MRLNKITALVAPVANQVLRTLKAGGDPAFASVQPENVAVTATVDGLTTAIIPAGTQNVTVTSGNSAHLVVLPAPVAGNVIWLNVAANGYKLRTSDPTTIKLNDVTGASVAATIGADVIARVYCRSATEWILMTWTKLGAVAAALVPS